MRLSLKRILIVLAVLLMEADVAKVTLLGGVRYQPNVVMSDKEVSFQDGEGDGVRVVLR